MRKSWLVSLVMGLSVLALAENNTAQLETQAVRAESLPVKINALLQAWALQDTSAVAPPHDNFRLRRAELKLSGSPLQGARYFLMVDPAKTINPTAGDGKILQDLGVGFTIVEGLEIIAGQFKTLTTAEGLESSSALLLPERSVVGRTFGDRREPGLMLGYTGTGYKLGAMVSNGAGPNLDATTDNKDLSLRADVTASKAWTVGAFGYFGDFEYNKKGRWGVNSRFAPTEVSTVGMEFAMGRTNGVNSYGVVGDAGYFVTDQIQPVVRYELLRSDSSKDSLAQQTSLGVNYVLMKNTAKVQAAYSYLQNLAGNNGSPKVAVGSFGHLVTLAFQMAI